VAVLDGKGRIVAANDAWLRFARGSGQADPAGAGVGVDYVSAWERTAADGDPKGASASEGIRGVLEGRRKSAARSTTSPPPRGSAGTPCRWCRSWDRRGALS